MADWWMYIVLAAALAAGLAIAARWARVRVRESNFARARQDFHRRREHLEAKFFQVASASGKPRGLAWDNCDFDDDVAYARDRQSGDLAAFVGVSISFEAIEGGGMEDNPNVANLRAATAVFLHSGGAWRTDGRVIFNLNPTEAIQRFHASMEMVARDVAAKV